MDTKTDKVTKLATYRIWRQGSGVRRFHTAPIIGEQTVGQHSWGVAALVNLLWPNSRKEVLVAALNHDIAEALTGDIPAPMKWESQSLAAILNEIEEKYEKLWGLHCELSPIETLMLKAADMLELVFFSSEQQNLGNKSFQIIMKRGVDYLGDLFEQEKPEYKEILLPALELLIDFTFGENKNGSNIPDGTGDNSEQPRGGAESSGN